MPSIVVSRFLVLFLLTAAAPAAALEFSAEQITRIDGHVRKATIYYRDDRWRLEHNDPGPVQVTIVREDKQVIWLLLPRLKHFKAVPFAPEHEPKVTARMDGEIAREPVGTEVLDGHPTTLYEVTTQEGAERRTYVYYQWLAEDIQFPLKLARKDDGWVVEYRHVGFRPLSDSLFQLPRSFSPFDE
ncbi:hypothetical protein [Candidatus Nitrospira bockiana]